MSIEDGVGVADVDGSEVAGIVPDHAKVAEAVDILPTAAGKRVHKGRAEGSPDTLSIASRDAWPTFRSPKVDTDGGVEERCDDEGAQEQSSYLVL